MLTIGRITIQKFRAVLFDLDDTLIDRRAGYNQVYRTLYDRHEAIHRATSWEEALEYFWGLSTNNATSPREAFVEIQRRWPGVPGNPDSHYDFYFEQMIRFVKVLPRAMEFIDWLNRSGMKWGVVTNGDRFQLEKIEATGLAGHIPFAVVSRLFGADKPAPAVYMEAVRLLDIPGIRTEEILFVGDNPYTDIIGAHGVGMKTAWIRMGREYPGDAPSPDLTVDHVEELKVHLG
ncbi:MAG: HAD-IA family hydrolase [Dehalococcoidia bacterium]|nr:HAD-IA family hydrolase [Dehalococcoidia bacterium]